MIESEVFKIYALLSLSLQLYAMTEYMRKENGERKGTPRSGSLIRDVKEIVSSFHPGSLGSTSL